MEEAFTCICGTQDRWEIYSARVECGLCGRTYRREFIDPSEFNRQREVLLTRDAQITEGGAS
jgi:hypothetical protein